MMRWFTRHTPWLVCLAFVAGTPAAAQIAKTDVILPEKAAGTNCVAYDSTNGVYLVVMNPSPAMGMFVASDGTVLSSEFLLTPDGPPTTSYVGWYSVAFGGPPNDPVFLFTYLTIEGAQNNVLNKYGRLIRYRAGAAPDISARTFITNTNGAWFASEKAQNVWDGDQFVVATYVQAGGLYPQPQLHHVDINGTVTGGVLLGDGLDYYGAPAVACSLDDKVCLITGFANGIPFGPLSQGGAYIRVVDARTLQPLTAMDYVDDHTSRTEDEWVVFNPFTGQFLTTWWARANAGGWVDSRLVGLDGEKGVVDYSRSFGPGAGDNRVAFNTATRTTLLVSKHVPADPNVTDDRIKYALYGIELGDDGAPVRPGNMILLTYYDGVAQFYKAGITADTVNARWFVEMWFGTGRAYLVQGTPVSSGPTVTTRGTVTVQAGGTVTINGYGFGTTQGASVIQLGGVALTVQSWSDTRIVALIPASAQSGDLTIIVNGVTLVVPVVVKRRLPVSCCDFDGDGKADIGIYRPSSGDWWIATSSNNFNTQTGSLHVAWGLTGDMPVPADYDGDGKTDVAVYRPSTGEWWVTLAGNGFNWRAGYIREALGGAAGDVPVPGDYDGDGKADVAIYRPSTGEWWALLSASAFPWDDLYLHVTWGMPGDVPVPGDYDGDGKADPAIYRPSTGEWWVAYSGNNYNWQSGYLHVSWGAPGDVPVPGDYDGDGKTDLAVFRAATHTWWVALSSNTYNWQAGYLLAQWGDPGDVPISFDNDGDGKSDIAVYRPSTGEWRGLWSGNTYNWPSGYLAFLWGLPGDVPLRR